MRVHAILALGAVASMLASAVGCGGGSTFPEEKPCTTPTATPTPARGVSGSTQYTTALRDGNMRLKNLTSDFRERWPDGKFYRQELFRPEYVEYAGTSKCIAAALRALQVPPSASTLQPSPRLLELKARYDPLLVALDRAFVQGTDAVRTRNVSEYRAFNRRIDELTVQMDEAITLPLAGR